MLFRENQKPVNVFHAGGAESHQESPETAKTKTPDQAKPVDFKQAFEHAANTARDLDRKGLPDKAQKLRDAMNAARNAKDSDRHLNESQITDKLLSDLQKIVTQADAPKTYTHISSGGSIDAAKALDMAYAESLQFGKGKNFDKKSTPATAPVAPSLVAKNQKPAKKQPAAADLSQFNAGYRDVQGPSTADTPEEAAYRKSAAKSKPKQSS